MLDRNDISHVHWQMKRTPDGAVLGEISTDLDDLSQSIRQCILTPKRSVPLNPEKGCDLEQFRDRPMTVRHLFVMAEVRDALKRDVPRVDVQEISFETRFDAISLSITWIPTEAAEQDFVTTVVDYAF